MSGSLGTFSYPLGGSTNYVETFRDALLGLLPPGLAFSRDQESDTYDLCERIGIELARVRERADDLRQDMDPASTVELLDEWELALGLPTTCYAPTTDAERRLAIVARLIGTGGNSLAAYKAVAASLGYDSTLVTATVHGPFTCLSPCTDALYQDTWAHVVEWSIPTGAADALLECTFDSKRRAHSFFLYGFV